MPRPLRPPDPGGTYHVTARGVDGTPVFRGDRDRHIFLAALDRIGERSAWQLLAYCLMTNHYHLLLTVPKGNLSAGMQRLNGAYAQGFNARHGRRGPLWQGRFHGVRIVRESQLLETARYVVLNPVRAELCRRPEEWAWSSHRAALGVTGARGPRTALLAMLDADEAVARRRYATLVEDGLRIRTT